MAEKQCNLIKNGGGSEKTITVIAQAAANKTWGAQLTELKPYYEALSMADKLRCFMKLGDINTNSNMYPNFGGGLFSRITIYNDLSTDILQLNILACTAFDTYRFSVTGSNISNNNNANILQLCVID